MQLQKQAYSTILLILLCLLTKAQDSITKKLAATYLSQVSSRVDKLSGKVDKKAEKALSQLQKEEEKICRKLHRVDSTKAMEVFGDVKDKYRNLEKKLQNSDKVTGYLGYLDTLTTSLNFLQGDQKLLDNSKDISNQLARAINNVKGFESSLARAENVKAFIRERTTYLKGQLSALRFTKELKKLNKQAYYYNAQISAYKEALNDSKKIEGKVIELLSKTKVFQEFMRKNSQLASLFRLPGNGEALDAASMQGLQTRAVVNAMIQDRIGNGVEAQALFRENVQGAQTQLSQFKNAVAKYSSGSYGNTNSDIEMPADFKPKIQKTKTFLNRMEYGVNVQNQSARYYFPVTSDIALSLGYKLNKGSIGIGASYKLGLGKGWKDIDISHQGFGIRSYVDFKLKGSLYLSGGYEQNYRTLFSSLSQLKDYSAWQSSGLLGLSKKYRINKKLKGNMQMLWDFLSYQQIPRTQSILFRVGYSLK